MEKTILTSCQLLHLLFQIPLRLRKTHPNEEIAKGKGNGGKGCKDEEAKGKANGQGKGGKDEEDAVMAEEAEVVMLEEEESVNGSMRELMDELMAEVEVIMLEAKERADMCLEG